MKLSITLGRTGLRKKVHKKAFPNISPLHTKKVVGLEKLTENKDAHGFLT